MSIRISPQHLKTVAAALLAPCMVATIGSAVIAQESDGNAAC